MVAKDKGCLGFTADPGGGARALSPKPDPAPDMSLSATDSESERSLSRLEAVASHSREEEGRPPAPGAHRMSEDKDCGGGDALSNGIKKHR